MKIRGNLKEQHSDVYTPAALEALKALASHDGERKALMNARIARRAERARTGTRIDFLAPDDRIPRTSITVRARAQRSKGRRFPATCSVNGSRAPARGEAERAGRQEHPNVAYALLSGADGWMFDGEDAGAGHLDVARQSAQPAGVSP